MEKIAIRPNSKTGITCPSDDFINVDRIPDQEKIKMAEEFVKSQTFLGANQKTRELARKYRVKHGPTGINPFI